MNERRLSALKEDWLAGNAVVAFVGVLLTAQSWNLSDGVYELPFNVIIPAFTTPYPSPLARSCSYHRSPSLWPPKCGHFDVVPFVPAGPSQCSWGC